MKGQWILKEVYFEDGWPSVMRDPVQPKQEPVAWANREELGNIKNFDGTIYANGGFDDAVPLYTTPPQRKSLTNEQLKPLIQKAMMYYGHNPDHWLRTSGAGFCILARAIEAAHGIKP